MPSSALKWRTTFGYYGLFVCLGLGMAIVGPTIPDLARQTGSTQDAIGWLFFGGSVGYTLGTLLGGRLFDRIAHGHALLGAAELVAAGLLAVLPTVHSIQLLLAIGFCRGLLEGMVNTGANTLLLWTHGQKASPFMNGLHFCFGVGASVSPLVVARFAPSMAGYRGAYWAVAGFAALASLWMLSMGGSPDPKEHTAKATRARMASGRPHYAPIAMAAIFLFAYVGGEISFGSWISPYAQMLAIATPVTAAYLASAFWASFTVGRLISIPVAIRFTPRQVIPAALVPCLVLSGLMMVLPQSSALLWATAIGLGFCLAPLWPSGFTLAGQVVSMTASASALVLLGDSFGGMVLPSLTGKVMTVMGGGGDRLLSLSLPMLVFGSLLVCLLAYLSLIAFAGRHPATASSPASTAGQG